ncbi:exodeoxyribonuclease V subunit beta [Alkalimonas amylolytica]|uniref:RecBCD enzyme subunit RecB n=1 Tax=Alkalimonas amylolytica TaxID=152573 RepID=A0A1H4BAU2_ALKAM|nr:exodeoxyribonuclease V subunit beta [Alkalimonas amylolytica]SEA45250.1 DNA helicase/exodeoxyribonuclease V, beta subunit [Alkalimonas amylolytica]
MKAQDLDLLHFPLNGSRLIEASAGTGKTFSLALLYVRLVLGHGTMAGHEQTAFSRALTPRDILVLTFTEAATEELRSRVRQRLVEAARLFRQSPAELRQTATSADPLLQLVLSYPDEAWPACALRLKRAAEAMDEAMIATIHGWCHKMLAEHAFDSRGLFQRELLTDQTELLDAIVKDYWRQHFYPLTAEGAAVVQQCYLNPDRLRKALLPLLRQADPVLLFAGSPLQLEQDSDLQALLAEAIAARQQQQARQAAFASLEPSVRQLWAKHWAELEQQLLALQSRFNATRHYSNTDEKFRQILTELAQWSRGQGTFDKKMTHFASGRFVWKKGQAPEIEPDHPAFVAMAHLAELWQQQADADAGTDDGDGIRLKEGILSHALYWCRQELKRRLNRQAQLGFNDLLTELHSALDPAQAGEHASQLAAGIRAAYPVALIDEFQDTDPVQYGIFNRIYRIADNDTSTAVVLIGDPKQAIYSFRGADIHTYLQARRDTAGRHYSLSRNFRSTQAVVDACNQLFLQAEAHPRAAFRFQSEGSTDNPLPYTAVSASGRNEQLLLDGKALPALHIQHLPGEEPWRISAYREHSAYQCASRIAFLLNAASAGRCRFEGEQSRPLAAEDIAVLVRSQQEAQLIKAELAKLQVPAVYLSDRGSVFATAEAADVLLWLRACASPMDLSLVKAALATPSLGLSLQQLMTWQQDELALEAQVQCFLRLQACWRNQGVLAMLRQLLDHYQLPARLLRQQDGERQLTNLLHLADWLQQQAVQLEGEQALIRQLAEHLDEPGEEQVIRLESDAALVKIITIHKSKGLEYPLVFLPFVVGWRPIDGKVRQVPYRDASHTGTEVAGKDAFPAAWQQADDERLSEDMRLLYVALTRARHGLWLGTAAVCVQGKKMQNHQGAFGYLLNGETAYQQPVELQQQLQALTGQGAVLQLESSDEAEPYQPAEALPELEPAASPQLPPYRRWWIASYSAIRFQAHAAERFASSPTHSTDPLSEPEDAKAALQAELYAAATAGVTFAAKSAARLTLPASASQLMHQLPKGAAFGTFVHALLEWAAAHRYLDAAGRHWSGFAAAVQDKQGRAVELQRRCQAVGLEDSAGALSDWLCQFLQQSVPLHGEAQPLQLMAVTAQQITVELEFLLPIEQVSSDLLDRLIQHYVLPGEVRPNAEPEQLNGMIKGFIDGVVEHQGRYYVLDWKTNSLGDEDASYSQQTMQQAMLSHRYDMQCALYLLALHRLLQSRLADYDYDRHIGGAWYWFVRGSAEPGQHGLWQYRPERALIEQLDALLRGELIPGEPPQHTHAAREVTS